MRLLSYCLMPNHWHLVLWPQHDGDLLEFMRWLTVTHTQRWHALYHSAGTGPLYQGRFKSFPVQEDEHLLAVCRYVERNALRANLVARAEAWRWCSLAQSLEGGGLLDAGPLARPGDWLAYVNRPETERELAALRQAVVRGCPLGPTGGGNKPPRCWAWKPRSGREAGPDGEQMRLNKTPDPFSFLRLQTYRSLIEDTPYTIRTTRPINPTFGDWLQRWGVQVERIE